MGTLTGPRLISGSKAWTGQQKTVKAWKCVPFVTPCPASRLIVFSRKPGATGFADKEAGFNQMSGRRSRARRRLRLVRAVGIVTTYVVGSAVSAGALDVFTINRDTVAPGGTLEYAGDTCPKSGPGVPDIELRINPLMDRSVFGTEAFVGADGSISRFAGSATISQNAAPGLYTLTATCRGGTGAAPRQYPPQQFRVAEGSANPAAPPAGGPPASSPSPSAPAPAVAPAGAPSTAIPTTAVDRGAARSAQRAVEVSARLAERDAEVAARDAVRDAEVRAREATRDAEIEARQQARAADLAARRAERAAR